MSLKTLVLLFNKPSESLTNLHPQSHAALTQMLCKIKHSENDKRLVTKSGSYSALSSKTGFNSGLMTWKLKATLFTSGGCFRIGVVSTPNFGGQDRELGNSAGGNTYYYDLNCAHTTTLLNGSANHNQSLTKWKTGEVVTVLLDFLWGVWMCRLSFTRSKFC